MEELYGGATPPDDLDPEVVERRRASRAADQAHRDHAHAVRHGHWPTVDGMTVDHHPGDSAPTVDPEQLHPEDDPTGRRAWTASTSPHVILHVACTAEGCDRSGTYYGSEDRLDRIRRAGGPRCSRHPLDPDALDQAPDPRPPRARGA